MDKIKHPLFLWINTPTANRLAKLFEDLPTKILNHRVKYVKKGYDQFDGEGMTQSIEDLDSNEVYKVEFKNPYWNKTIAGCILEDINSLYYKLQKDIEILFKKFRESMH